MIDTFLFLSENSTGDRYPRDLWGRLKLYSCNHLAREGLNTSGKGVKLPGLIAG